MARPTYGIDAVALALAVILAAAIAFLVSQIMPPLADLMMPRYEVIVGDDRRPDRTVSRAPRR